MSTPSAFFHIQCTLTTANARATYCGKNYWIAEPDKVSWFQINNPDHSSRKVTLNIKSDTQRTELLPPSKALGSFRLPCRTEVRNDSEEQVTQEHSNALKSS